MKRNQPTHPPCWVVAPSLCPFQGELFDKLRASEDALLAKGTKIRVVVFDSPEPVMGVAVFNASQKQPTSEQLERIYREVCGRNALHEKPIGGEA